MILLLETLFDVGSMMIKSINYSLIIIFKFNYFDVYFFGGKMHMSLYQINKTRIDTGLKIFIINGIRYSRVSKLTYDFSKMRLYSS